MGGYNVGFRVQGSWVVISLVISPLIWVISIVTLTYNPTYNYP